jgi:glutamine synthetase
MARRALAILTGASVGQALAEAAKQKGIKQFLISYLDLFGVQRAKLVPASAIASVASSGAGFAGFAAHFDLSPADADVLAVPDPSSLIQLPWKKEVGWLASDLYMSGRPFEQSPRRVLQRQLARAATAGYTFKTGVEVEFMLLQNPSAAHPDAPPSIDPRDAYPKPCYEQGALMRQYDILAEISAYVEELGWEPYQVSRQMLASRRSCSARSACAHTA